MKTNVHFLSYLAESFFADKICRETQNTFYVQLKIFMKIVPFMR